MGSITVEAHLVDGGVQPCGGGVHMLKKYHALHAQGLRGKELIRKLITDDWAAPPNLVHIFGRDEDGKAVDITIPYR
jgi:hypothetical protein